MLTRYLHIRAQISIPSFFMPRLQKLQRKCRKPSLILSMPSSWTSKEFSSPRWRRPWLSARALVGLSRSALRVANFHQQCSHGCKPNTNTQMAISRKWTIFLGWNKLLVYHLAWVCRFVKSKGMIVDELPRTVFIKAMLSMVYGFNRFWLHSWDFGVSLCWQRWSSHKARQCINQNWL